jgi:predicted transcriptional regulator
MRKLTLANRAEIINIYKPSMSLQIVANLVGVSKTMVSRILKEKKKENFVNFYKENFLMLPMRLNRC